MRIGLILHRKPVYSETFLLTLMETWQALGHEVLVFGGWEGQPPTSHYRPALPLHLGTAQARSYLSQSVLRGWWFHPALWRFFRLERRAKTPWLRALKRVYFNAHLLTASLDWVHLGYLSTAIQRERVGQALGLPITGSARGADVGQVPLANPDAYVALWKTLNRIHVLSDDLATLARQAGMPDTLPIHKISPMVSEPLPELRTPRSLKDGPLRLAWVGRLTWKKNPALALEVVEAMQNQGIEVQLTMMGAGELEEEVNAKCMALPDPSQVVCQGRVPHGEVLKVLPEFDVLLHTAWQEGFGNVLLEAQAAGVWVVATPAEGVGENLADGVTGCMVRDWQTKGLVQAILRYRETSIVRQAQHASQSRARIQAKFGPKGHQEAWQRFFGDQIR